MATRVLLIDSSAVPIDRAGLKQMAQDLSAVSTIPEDVLTALSKELEDETGFLTAHRLAEIVGRFVQGTAQVNGVCAALLNLRPKLVGRSIDELNEWREAHPESAEGVTAETVAALRRRLPLFIREYPALERARKANRLATVTGNTAREVELICDLRPVFDKKRENIEGLLPLTTLKIGYERQNGDSGVLEVLFTEDMLTRLLEEVNKAHKKLESLREHVEEWLPDGWVSSLDE